MLLAPGLSCGTDVALDAPKSAARFEPAEFVLRVSDPAFSNPFTEAELTGEFSAPGIPPVQVYGFSDSQDGGVFRLRFSPGRGRLTYKYSLRFRGAGIDRRFAGELRSEDPKGSGPVIADPRHPKHFIYSGTGAPFYHLGYTAYHLLDTSNSEAQVDATIDYCARLGFNKIRFLLTGYPRDFDARTSGDVEHGVPDPWKKLNYGARPGQVLPLPAWTGKPHAYDFTRFNVAHWRRVERAVRRMRDRGIVATCIVTIEKQDLPKEYGRLTEHELRLYRYAVARLAAFDNVWWDLGNEHNEFRDPAWGDAMGAVVKALDPYDRLASAHAYAEFPYSGSAWADYIITQQYGDEKAVHDWALKHFAAPKPYVNEEYGYEGGLDKPGHGQNADWVRRNHWAIAMAGGYATYGDWSEGTSWFYMGEPGPGVAAGQLRHLRAFFERLPFPEMQPCDERTTAGFCLARLPGQYVFYFPRGGAAQVEVASAGIARWFDPRNGEWHDGPALSKGKNSVNAPANGDWILYFDVRN